VPAPATPAVDLRQQVDALRAALQAGDRLPEGRLLGLPELDDDCWVDIAGAAAITGFQPNTITGWLTRGGPRHRPFPEPHRHLYRLLWPRHELMTWKQRSEPRSATGR
jgi:hypothetical protein